MYEVGGVRVRERERERERKKKKRKTEGEMLKHMKIKAEKKC